MTCKRAKLSVKCSLSVIRRLSGNVNKTGIITEKIKLQRKYNIYTYCDRFSPIARFPDKHTEKEWQNKMDLTSDIIHTLDIYILEVRADVDD